MTRKATGWLVALAVLAPLAARAQDDESWTLQAMDLTNGVLKAQWMDIRIEQVEVLPIRQARSTYRLHRQPSRWVLGDARRPSTGGVLTYMVDEKAGPRGEAVPPAFEAAIDQGIATWTAEPCLSKVRIVKEPYTGEDATIFDAQFGYGGLGDWKAADIVFGGWMPPSFFDAVIGQGAGESVLALSVTFVFVGPDGKPTDVDGDHYLDVATNEIYFNDAFPWAAGSDVDVATVVLHEVGHTLGIGHFGPPPVATMNPVYAGVSPQLRPWDHAAACSIWASWHCDGGQ
jgi:hypothetical protein